MYTWFWQKKETPRVEPPHFVELLQAQNSLYGNEVKFECQVRGNPTPKVLWYHGSKEISESPEFHMEHDAESGLVSLTINEVFIDDKGLYNCVAVNQFGKDETTAYLTVEDLEMLEKSELRQAPRLLVPIQAKLLPVGSSTEFLVRYEAFPPPTIKWYRHGKEIKPSTDFVIENSECESILKIPEVLENDAGEYQVRIFNDAGEARSTASIFITQPMDTCVMKPPIFIKTLAPQSVPEGEIAILEAEVTAEPEVQFSWYRHGQKLRTDDELEIRINTTKNKTCLLLGEVYEDDSGDYTVVATNEVGEASSTATLLVEGTGTEEAIPPSFNPPLTPIRVMDGEEVRFMCKVSGQPMPKLGWFHNGRPLSSHREVRLMQTPDGRAGLLISEVFPEDEGDYTCIARNKAGEARTTANLAVEAYEYQPDSEVATITSTSEKQVASGAVSEEDTLEIDKDSETDSSEVGSSPFFCSRLDSRTEVKEGSSVRLIAKCTGYPLPEMKWYADGHEIQTCEEMLIEKYEDGMSTLTISYVVLNHCGEYTCDCMNRNGVDTTLTQLIVIPEEHAEGTSKEYRKPDWVVRMEELKHAMEAERVSPKFIQVIQNGRAREMENYTFFCHFTGNPKPEITWYQNDKLIHQHQSFQMRVRGDKAMLTIVEASPSHKGEYVCRAVNSAGEIVCKAKLEIIELSYEEKLRLTNERYAALQIQHAAEHMKLKERERAEKELEQKKEAIARLKDEKQQRIEQKEKELEDAKKNVWKPKLKLPEAQAEKKEEKLYATPKERRVASVYQGWKQPLALEDSYPELTPEEFAPNQIPGVKCFVQVSETSVKGEEVIRDIAPQFFEDDRVIQELAQVHTLLKSNVRVNEVWSRFRAGEFPLLSQPNIQSALVKICEHIGHQRNVSIVLAQETREQASRHPVGLKAFLRMVKYAKNVKPDTIFKEVIPREMGKWSSTTQELQKVSQMINQGIQHEEIIASCEAGKLPTLKKPETQQPLINVVEKQGHSVMVAQVLVEEAYRDAKDERVLAASAWESIHEEDLCKAKVSKVKSDTTQLTKATEKQATKTPTQHEVANAKMPLFVESVKAERDTHKPGVPVKARVDEAPPYRTQTVTCTATEQKVVTTSSENIQQEKPVTITQKESDIITTESPDLVLDDYASQEPIVSISTHEMDSETTPEYKEEEDEEVRQIQSSCLTIQTETQKRVSVKEETVTELPRHTTEITTAIKVTGKVALQQSLTGQKVHTEVFPTQSTELMQKEQKVAPSKEKHAFKHQSEQSKGTARSAVREHHPRYEPETHETTTQQTLDTEIHTELTDFHTPPDKHLNKVIKPTQKQPHAIIPDSSKFAKVEEVSPVREAAQEEVDFAAKPDVLEAKHVIQEIPEDTLETVTMAEISRTEPVLIQESEVAPDLPAATAKQETTVAEVIYQRESASAKIEKRLIHKKEMILENEPERSETTSTLIEEPLERMEPVTKEVEETEEKAVVEGRPFVMQREVIETQVLDLPEKIATIESKVVAQQVTISQQPQVMEGTVTIEQPAIEKTEVKTQKLMQEAKAELKTALVKQAKKVKPSKAKEEKEIMIKREGATAKETSVEPLLVAEELPKEVIPRGVTAEVATEELRKEVSRKVVEHKAELKEAKKVTKQEIVAQTQKISQVIIQQTSEQKVIQKAAEQKVIQKADEQKVIQKSAEQKVIQQESVQKVIQKADEQKVIQQTTEQKSIQEVKMKKKVPKATVGQSAMEKVVLQQHADVTKKLSPTKETPVQEETREISVEMPALEVKPEEAKKELITQAAPVSRYEETTPETTVAPEEVTPVAKVASLPKIVSKKTTRKQVAEEATHAQSSEQMTVLQQQQQQQPEQQVVTTSSKQQAIIVEQQLETQQGQAQMVQKQETVQKQQTVQEKPQRKVLQQVPSQAEQPTKHAKPRAQQPVPEDTTETLKIEAIHDSTAEIHEEAPASLDSATVTQVTTELCVPGFKALVQVATQGLVDLETAELKPIEKKLFQKDIANLCFQVKNGVQVQKLMMMMKEGEFPNFKPPEYQASLLGVVGRLERATVHRVIVQEASERKEKNIGVKSMLKTISRGREAMDQMIMDVSREFGPSSEPVKETAAIGLLLREGVTCEEVVSLADSGLLPSLTKPQAQVPLVSMMLKKGHVGTICEILVEDSLGPLQKKKSPIASARLSEVKELLVKAKIASIDVKTFSPEMVPGVKAFVKMAQKEDVCVEDIVMKSSVEKQIKEDMSKIGAMVKHGVVVEDVITLMEAGEFPQLMTIEAQAQLLTVVEEFGFQAIVNEVMIEQAVQKSDRAIGMKSFIRMAKESNINLEHLITEKFPEEMGPEAAEPIRELAKVSVMLKEGVQSEEIMAMADSGQLPALQKPEVQLPLLNVIGKEGHSALVCQVIIEESIKDMLQELPKVEAVETTEQPPLELATTTETEVREDASYLLDQLDEVIELGPPSDVKEGDQLRAIATYVAEGHDNAIHLIEGEKVYIKESTNSEWWFVEKNLTKEEGFVPSKLLAEEITYTHYVQQRLEDKMKKLPVFEKLKKGQKAKEPEIVTKLESQSVKDGQEVQFTCRVDGIPKPNITWFRQTAIIKASEEFQMFYSDDNTATLVIKEVFPEDAGQFTCVAKNQVGAVSCSAELVVEGPVSDHGSENAGASRRSLSRESSLCDLMEGIPPTFAQKPMLKTAEEGSAVELDARLVAIPDPEIVWRKDGQALRDSNRLRIVKQKDVHAYRSIVCIKGVRKEDEGLYEVFVKNKEGEARNAITLKVTAPETPAFEEKFQDTTVEDQGTIRLVARIHGVPTPDVTWSSTFKRGLESCVVEETSEVTLECRTSKEKECKWFKGKTELKTSERLLVEQEGLTHRLVIHSCSVADTGRYKCTFDKQTTQCNLTVKGTDEFVQKLQDVEVQENEKAVLEVEVTTESATVSWQKDSEEITADGERIQAESVGKFRRLVITSATLSDEGEYTCVMGDLDCSCELGVRERPAEIVRSMKDAIVSKGAKATFEIELTKGDAVITWFKDEKEIKFSDHYQLSIDGKIQRLLVYNCQPQDGGRYKATVGKSECFAILQVEFQVEGDFRKKLPAQMDVNFGSDAEFTVELTKQEQEVKWLRNGSLVEASEKYIIKKESHTRTLIVKGTSQADATEYTCVLGTLKTTCKLNIIVLEMAPQLEKDKLQSEYVVTKGDDLTITVPFRATPKPRATWSHKGEFVDVEKAEKITATVTENAASITIKQVEIIDCGEYKVKLCNGCGSVTTDFTVKILDKPSQPGKPEPLKVTDNSVTLHWTPPADDGGRTILNYIIEYTMKAEEKWTTFNKETTIKETTTVITNLQKDQEMSFRVSAVNEIGKSESSGVSEFIKVSEPVKAEPPVIKEPLHAVVTGIHQTVVMRCVAIGSPAPTVQWSKDGHAVTSNTKYENFVATLTIQDTNESSAGNYTCKASNEAGEAECTASVIIQESPKFEYEEKLQCQRLFVGSKWHVPVKVTGFPQPKMTWNSNDQPIQEKKRVVVHAEETEGLTDIAIQKLTLEDSGVYTLTIENSAGKAVLSLNLRVIEEEKEPEEQVCPLEEEEGVKKERPAAPEGPLLVDEVTSSSVTLSWKLSPHDGGCEITSQYIEKLEKGQKQWQKVDEVGPTITSYTVQNLLQEREYFFRVFACNAIGLSDALQVSESVLIKSPFDVPGPPVGPFDVSAMSESGFTIQWGEPEHDGGKPITGYLLERRESTKKSWQKVVQTEGNVTEAEVAGLKRGSSYLFRVFALNEIGQSSPLQPEEPITAGKKMTVPSKPTSLQVIDVTSKTVTLAWAPPASSGGTDLSGYVIEKRLTSQDKWERIETVDSSVTLYCIENLKEKSEYEFRIFAENPIGLSEEAAVTEKVLLKTHATPPSPPTSPLEARPTGPNSLMIEWGAPESDGGSPLLGYIIAIRDIKRTMWIEVGQVEASFTRLHIKELQEEHEYYVRVFARNEVGTSNPLETDEPVKVIRPADFLELPEDDAAPSLSYSTTETLSWMREAGVDADIYSYAKGRLLNRDEYFFKVWHQGKKTFKKE